jgi:hypothetical protein
MATREPHVAGKWVDRVKSYLNVKKINYGKTTTNKIAVAADISLPS